MNKSLFIPLNISTHSGKMAGIQSISTSVALNPFCKKHAKIIGSICSKCYANRYVSFRKSLRIALEHNTTLLTNSVIPEYQLPHINSLFFRFEAFGDLMNETQVINYFNICKCNPHTRFALWTKNLPILAKVINSGVKKPKNLNIVYSSIMENIPVRSDIVKRLYPFVDIIFTVYTSRKDAEKANAVINCGDRKCNECLYCYKPVKAGNVKIVSELEK